jgi:hypothetical protein
MRAQGLGLGGLEMGCSKRIGLEGEGRELPLTGLAARPAGDGIVHPGNGENHLEFGVALGAIKLVYRHP